MPGGYPGSTPGIDPRSQGVIPRRFKRKKNFVTDERTNERTDERTDSLLELAGFYLPAKNSKGYGFGQNLVQGINPMTHPNMKMGV